jgi:hypothetical protein
MFQTKAVENIKTHILFSITFFRKSIHLRDNVEKYGRARHATNKNIIRRMRFACRITKATDTLGICNTAFPRQQWFRERAAMLRYTYIACLFVYMLHPNSEIGHFMKQATFCPVRELASSLVHFTDQARTRPLHELGSAYSCPLHEVATCWKKDMPMLTCV